MNLDLSSAILIQRYKRFLADVTLSDGNMTTMHVANTGAMTGCAQPKDIVWYSKSPNPKRKYPFSWELTQTQHNHFICVNTIRANQLAEEAILNGTIVEVQGFNKLEREVKYGEENSRVDLLLTYEPKPGTLTKTYIEVKSVTLLEQGQGYFPDTVTTRGQKHLRELMTLVKNGHRAILLFTVLHTGIKNFKVATHIDKKYAELFKEAIESGVEILVYQADISPENISLTKRINFK